MAQDSEIGWTDDTGNIWWGCTEIHAGCDNCYARIVDKHWTLKEGGKAHWGSEASRRMIKSFTKDMARYQRLASSGTVEPKTKFGKDFRAVFVGSMMDIFEKPMPLVDIKGNEVTMNPDDGGMPDLQIMTSVLRDKFFSDISAGLYPNLVFLLLTKRPGNILRFIPTSWHQSPPARTFFGTSIVDQPTTDMLLPKLLKVPGRKFLSVEPMIKPLSIKRYLQGQWMEHVVGKGDVPGIDWVICGGESGGKRRPFNLDWARSLRDECLEAGVPFFFKQIDKVRDYSEGIPEDLQIRQFPKL